MYVILILILYEIGQINIHILQVQQSIKSSNNIKHLQNTLKILNIIIVFSENEVILEFPQVTG